MNDAAISRRTERSRNEILDAAERVATRLGPHRVTLDAVAQEAGFSKGGLIYQFPTKEALIGAMMARLVREYDEAVETRRNELGDQPNRTLVAMLETDCNRHETQPAVTLAVIAASMENAELLDPIRDFFAERIRALTDEAEDGDLALLVWLAAEGLMLTRLFGANPLPEADVARLRERLVTIARTMR